MTCFADLIGVQFRYGGRGPDAYDCWGLLQECHKRWHGVELPDYRSSDMVEENAAIMAREGERLWRRLPDLAPGAVLLMRVNGFGAHVGFQTSHSRFIQALDGLGVIESRIGTFKQQIIGAYEYVGEQSD